MNSEQPTSNAMEGGEQVPPPRSINVGEEAATVKVDDVKVDVEQEAPAVDEHGLPLLPTGDAEKDREIKELHKIIRQERSHGQWAKQGLNLVSLVFLLLQSLLRGGGKIGFAKCSAGDWTFMAIFFVVMIIIVVVAVKLVAA
jgi:hypothetical protein